MKTVDSNKAGIKYVNVIMHGAYDLIFDENCIWAYTPACFAHMYNAGRRDFRKNAKLDRRTHYTLVGVQQAKQGWFTPDSKYNPVLSLAALNINRNTDVDSLEKRYTRIRLPYPAKESGNSTNPMTGVARTYVGEIYSGKRAAAGLNAMDSCPAVQTIVYQLDPNEEFGLLGGDDTLISDTDPSSASDRLNFHIFCTKDPDTCKALMDHGTMTDEGHMRRTFAAMVELMGSLELTLNFPDRFYPTKVQEQYPSGIDEADLEPDTPPNAHDQEIRWGKVNCGSGNLIFIA